LGRYCSFMMHGSCCNMGARRHWPNAQRNKGQNFTVAESRLCGLNKMHCQDDFKWKTLNYKVGDLVKATIFI
jgi:hypothetical protein